MMKKIIIWIILCLALIVSAKAQNDARVGSYLTLSEAKEIADVYYGAFQEIAKHPIGDTMVQNQYRIMDVIGNDIYGNALGNYFRVPNDLVAIAENSLADMKTVLITNYIGCFSQIAETGKIDYSYKVLSNEYQRGPEMRKNNDTPPFVMVVVQKTMKTPNSSTVQIVDSMFLDTKNKTISLITNQYRGVVIDYESMTIEALYAEAQKMYFQKRYTEAYKLFQKVLKKNPRHADASYNLGVMCFKGEGCKQYPRKVRDYLVEFYWQKSDAGIRELMRNQGSQYVVLSSLSGMESDPFPSNRLLTHKNGKVGYISPKGKMVIKQQYLYGFPFFTNGTALVQTDKDEWLLIDTIGGVKGVYSKVRVVTGNMQLIVTQADKKGVVKKEGVINRMTGEWDIPPISRVYYWYELADIPICYFANKDGECGVLSPNNEVLVPFDYYNMIYVSDGLGWIKILCDYDETKYDQLWEKYKDSSKIPEIELNNIGTLIKVTFKIPEIKFIQIGTEKFTF